MAERSRKFGDQIRPVALGFRPQELGLSAEVTALNGLPVGRTVTLSAAPVVTASAAYASGNLLGLKLRLDGAARAPGAGGRIISVALFDASNQKSAVDLVFFTTDPTGTTFTDKSAFAPAAADLLLAPKVQSLTAADYALMASGTALACRGNIGIGYQLANGATALFVALVCRGTPTYGATTDLRLFVDLELD